MPLRSWPEVCKVLLVIMFLTQGSSSDTSCPHGCICSGILLDCRHSNLTSLPTNIPLAENITEMLMSGNRIKSIEKNLRAFPVLKKLDVSINNISDIKTGAFIGLSRLNTLIMRRNFLSKLANETFQGLVNLETLDLGYNMLKAIPDFSFYDLRSLKELDLMKNNISLISEKAFYGLQSLKVLNLTRNLIQHLPAKAISKLSSLTTLILDDNKLKYINQLTFSGLRSLSFLSLNGNHLETIHPLSFAGVTPPLKVLNLKGADLDEVPVEAFKRLTKLEILDISKNNFSSLKRGSFSELTSLRKLIVTSSKHLSRIENGTFQFMFKLEELIIKNNKALVYIGRTAFPSAQTLRFVDLSCNSITTFYPSIVEWHNNVTVDLRHNNLFCDCKILWMVDTLKNAANAKTRLFANNLTCAEPSLFAGKVILELPVSGFLCTVRKSLAHDSLSRVKVAAIAAATASIILLTCALFIKFRKRMCAFVRRQYRYRHYKNNGVFTINGKNGDLHEEGTPMEVMSPYKDDPDLQASDTKVFIK